MRLARLGALHESRSQEGVAELFGQHPSPLVL